METRPKTAALYKSIHGEWWNVEERRTCGAWLYTSHPTYTDAVRYCHRNGLTIRKGGAAWI